MTMMSSQIMSMTDLTGQTSRTRVVLLLFERQVKTIHEICRVQRARSPIG